MKFRLSPFFSFLSRPQSSIFLRPTSVQIQCRPLSSSARRKSNPATTSEPSPTSTNARWLSDIKARIGKCVMFGMDEEQAARTAVVCRVLGEEWRDLVAGREGFLVDRKSAGLLRQGVVWGEMDCMNHVNNVTYTRYAESARINWAYNFAIHKDPGNKDKWFELWTPRGDGLILRSIRTDYKFPMTYPDRVSVFHKLRSLPSHSESSFILDVMIMSELHQRPAARCVEDIVVYDYRAGKKVTIRPFMLDGFTVCWREQEEERLRVEKRIKEVEGWVTSIEKGTWDRVGAVEDMGTKR